MFLIFLFIVFGVYGGLHFYIYSRLLFIIPDTALCINILRIIICFLAALYPVGHILRNYTGHWIFSPFIMAGAVWMGLALYVLLGLVVIDLGRVILWITGIGHSIPHNIRTLLPYGAAIILNIFVIIVGTLAFIEAHKLPTVTKLDVRISDLPSPLEGLRIMQITDLHLDAIVASCRLDRVITCTNALKPDIVVITGDFIDESAHTMNNIKETLSELSAPLGVYAVTGNHEFYAGVEQAVALLESAGIQVLRNRMVTVADSLQIIGLDDPSGSRQTGEGGPDIGKAFADYTPDLPSILLYHQPVRFEQFAAKGVDLMLSGHTHGGQLWPLGYITRLFYKRSIGLFHVGESMLYVSRGTGTWGPPMRFRTPPEIVLIRLVRY